MYSIYHFFHSLVRQKHLLKKAKKLDLFSFDKKLLSCKNDGIFPDMAIRLNKDRKIFTGGELIELKDSDSYTVSSFNSTIPSRTKKIEEIIKAEGNILNPKKYPEIKDDTLNFVLPRHNEKEEKEIVNKAELVFDPGQFNIFKIKHHFNGYFLVFQVSL